MMMMGEVAAKGILERGEGEAGGHVRSSRFRCPLGVQLLTCHRTW